jgi:hypothetical protein
VWVKQCPKNKNFPKSKPERKNPLYKGLLTAAAVGATFLPVVQNPEKAQAQHYRIPGSTEYRNVTESFAQPSSPESSIDKLFSKHFGPEGNGVIYGHYVENGIIRANEYRNSLMVVPTGTTPEQYKAMLAQRIAQTKAQMTESGQTKVILILRMVGGAAIPDGVQLRTLSSLKGDYIDIEVTSFRSLYPGAIGR